jgi:hypothetical protein
VNIGRATLAIRLDSNSAKTKWDVLGKGEMLAQEQILGHPGKIASLSYK